MADPHRESLLARVRQAQRSARLPAVDAPDPPPSSLESAAPDSWRERFLQELEILGVTTHVAKTEQALQQVVAELVAGRRLLIWDPARLPYGLASVLEPGSWIDATAPRAEKERAEDGVTAVDAAIAETGSLVLLSAASAPRTASLLPPVHLAVVRASDVVPTLGWYLERKKDWLEFNLKYEDAVPDHWGWSRDSDQAPSPPTSLDYDKPVVNVTWEQARDFCRHYLAELPGCEGARLPTSYEWEKAARGARDARIYPWGSSFLTPRGYIRCNSRAALYGAPVSVLIFADRDVSPYGVVGMGGNVAEFVNAAELEVYLVPGYRGGDYDSDEFDVRIHLDSTTQGRSDVTFAFVGFRAVRPLSGEKEEGR